MLKIAIIKRALLIMFLIGVSGSGLSTQYGFYSQKKSVDGVIYIYLNDRGEEVKVSTVFCAESLEEALEDCFKYFDDCVFRDVVTTCVRMLVPSEAKSLEDKDGELSSTHWTKWDGDEQEITPIFQDIARVTRRIAGFRSLVPVDTGRRSNYRPYRLAQDFWFRRATKNPAVVVIEPGFRRFSRRPMVGICQERAP